ncbi:MAG: hypothetical protein HLUCCA11_19415 [Phormidesmis priestleyi Ana]|uniref:Uncharacterized protein n=1 Tax=Phormidesmis priestleyi Ana TaxID=1666911 RepID=A0A0P7ZEX3_9CYAN|nr:MAG: hypothetical protein HLUCCA11_19415 [Phormidesmis priestleyi Ana]
MAKVGSNSTPAQEVYEAIATEPGVKGDPGNSFRSRTQFLLQHWEDFKDRLRPVMLGSVIKENATALEGIYLIATDQSKAIERFRESDTRYAAEIIARWIEVYYHIPCKLILVGESGENPTDFDEMVRWSKQSVWSVVHGAIANQPSNQIIDKILVSPKGGVSQCSEALRVTALTGFTEQSLQFCDFTENIEENRRGQFSAHELSSGTHYLWELSQRQAIALLDRYDYAGAYSLLRSYWKNSPDPQILQIKDLIEVAIKWNIAEFRECGNLLKHYATQYSIDWDLSCLDEWYWFSYESAYLSVVRFQQGHTIEALFHSFRSVEGLIFDWAIATYPDDIQQTYRAPELKPSIDEKLPGFYASQSKDGKSVYLYGTQLDFLLLRTYPEIGRTENWQQFANTARKQRNNTFHKLLGLKKEQVFEAWGTPNKERWQSRVLGCLNSITHKEFDSLEQASLMPQIHNTLKTLIADYQL